MFKHSGNTQRCHSERSEESIKTAREAVPCFAPAVFRHLLWKEWRENLWKLTFGGAVSAAFVLLLFRIRLFPDSQNCIMISFVQMLALPVIYALDIFSGEMSNRTIHLIFKFPVPRWKIFFSKYFISIGGMITVFLISGLLMELIAQGRETDPGFLLKLNASFGISALLLFTWFCAFDVQNRSEGESLIAIIVVIIGWGAVFLWAGVCNVKWAIHFVPYNYITIHVPEKSFHIDLIQLILSTGFAAIINLVIACYRFVKIRRVL